MDRAEDVPFDRSFFLLLSLFIFSSFQVQEPLTALFGKMLEVIGRKDQMDANSAAQWLEVSFFQF